VNQHHFANKPIVPLPKGLIDQVDVIVDAIAQGSA
jgi:hypothetical protein